jgi:Matrixin
MGIKMNMKLELQQFNKTKKWIRLIVLHSIFSLFVLGCQPKAQNQCGFVQNVYGQRISWKTKGPIELVIAKDIPVQLRPAIYRAAATWEKIVGEKLFNLTEDYLRAGERPSKDGKNGIYFLSTWESDRKSEQGRTTVYWGADQIMEADIRINALDFSYYDQNQKDLVVATSRANLANAMTTSEGYSFEALILHEMGHMLGLKHAEDKGSVMATHLSAFTDRTQPSVTDIQSLQCGYSK